jgi:hypothetical protein
MEFTAYLQLFTDILADPAPRPPYDNPHYQNYVRLNWSRQHRWLKTGVLDPALTEVIRNIGVPQYWTVITEPWCGDASHSIPFIHRLAELNPLIKVDYVLRDTPPFLIDQYLTNGTKSIPKLIIADKDHNDLAVWGPRPAACQRLYQQMAKDNVEQDERKITLQNWYNEDKGESLQRELLEIIP